jgi:endonuclease/exonuclease/phosphatase family metal-dependent hydrolase
MCNWLQIPRRAGKIFLLGALFFSAQLHAQSNVTVRVMASNLSSGSLQRYETAGLNILKGLQPDIVAMQEFNVSNTFGINTAAALSNMVATTFGTDFVYFRETGYAIPNGIISRYPILTNGSWVDSDTGVNDRGFAWALIGLPGTNQLYVVSVHLKASSGTANEDRRTAESAEVKALISTNFPPNAWIIVAGDMNLYSETEGAITTLKTFLSDSPVPADQNGDPDTNAGRAQRYDRVLLSFSMTNTLVPLALPSHTFPNGLVFDSRVYTPLTDVTPVQSGDSGVTGMQHMGVLKDFTYTIAVTNNGTAPLITTQPQSQSVEQAANATFTVTASGSPALSYQWRFGLANLAGATASSYSRNNVQPADVGNYSVVVSNTAGTDTSSNATLALIVPSPVLTILAADALQWQGLSNLNYTVQSRTNLDQTNWPALGTASSPNHTIWFTNPAVGEVQRYYRVVYP